MGYRILVIQIIQLCFITSLIGQKTNYSATNIQLIKSTCKICQSNGNSKNKLYPSNVDKLYHQLHAVLKRNKKDSILTTSTALKVLLVQNKDRYSNYLAPFYNFYGLQLDRLKLYEEALATLEKSLQFAKKTKEKCTILNNLATFHMSGQWEDFNKALSYLSKAESLIKDSEDLFTLKLIYENKALCYFYIQKFALAEDFYQQTINLEKTLHDSTGLAKTYMNLANLYYEQYLDDKAIPLFKTALSLAEKTGDLSLLLLTQENMAIIYENAKDYETALSYYKAYQITLDSIDNFQEVRDFSTQEQNRLKEQRKQKEVQMRQQQILFGTIGSAILSILLLIGYQYYSSLKKNKVIAAQKQEVEQLNTIKDELLSVLGHDLRSPMQHLISVFDRSFRAIKKGDEQKLYGLLQHGNLAVSKTSILLDNILQWVTQQNKQTYFNKETVMLAPLIHQVTANFTPILEMRAIQLDQTIPMDNQVLADRNSLKIIIRNIVDNAIKFTPKNGQIHIYTTTETADKLTIHIQDTGPGMSPKILHKLKGVTQPGQDASGRKSTGLGLRLSTDFIKRNSGILAIESEEGKGSRFSITLPISN